MKYIIYVLLFGFLVGCASKPNIIVREVKIPVVVECPQPPQNAFNRPDLPIHNLSPEADNDEVVKSYAESIKLLQQWGTILEEYLRGYSKE